MPARSKDRLPNNREAVILSILVGRERYGREIRDEYEEAVREKLPLGSLYTTLERMDQKGFVRSRPGESSHERGGNRRRYFRITAPGQRALAAYRERAAAVGPEGVARA